MPEPDAVIHRSLRGIGPWLTTQRVYRARRDWNIRLNGRNVEYLEGLTTPVHAGDEMSVFPPGR